MSATLIFSFYRTDDFLFFRPYPFLPFSEVFLFFPYELKYDRFFVPKLRFPLPSFF